MPPERVVRKLAAILAADVVGYSRLMGVDEEGTLRRLKNYRKKVIDPKIAEHGGRIVKVMGDGILVEFPSAVAALRCAVEFQRAMAERNDNEAADRRIEFRVGIHQGDIIVEGSDILGDGVNIAARLEGMAEPGNICVSARIREDATGKANVAFEDMGEQKLKNIARPVRAYRVRIRQSRATERPVLALPEKPSIAVLPFQNMSGDPEQEYFSDGMVEEIITALSRIRSLFVIARNSTFTYKKQHAIDVKQVGRDLGVLYVLEGSVRKAGGRVRITAQLIDATSGAHLWADHFDGPLESVFELQDNVASSVTGIIEPTVRVAEFRRSAQRAVVDMTAYDLYLRAWSDAESWERERISRALDLIQQALARDPLYGSALALSTICYVVLHVNGWTDDLDMSRRHAIDNAHRALRVAGEDPYVLALAAYALAYFGEDINAALALIDRSLELNPSYARGWVRSGWLRLWAGQPDRAIEHFETALRLSPRESKAGVLLGIGIGHFFARRLEQALTALRFSLQELPNWAPTLRFLASCCAHIGRLEEARDAVKHLRNVTTIVIPTAEHWRVSADREFYLNGLRMAVQ